MTDKNSIDFNDIDEVFDFAIGKEKEAHDFYIGLAEMAEKSAMKEVFREFAAQEEAHQKLFTELKESHAKLEPTKKVVDLHITDYILVAEPSGQLSYPEALRLAIQREQAAIDLYGGFAAASQSDVIKSAMERLVQEETRHKVKLETIYDDSCYPDN